EQSAAQRARLHPAGHAGMKREALGDRLERGARRERATRRRERVLDHGLGQARDADLAVAEGRLEAEDESALDEEADPARPQIRLRAATEREDARRAAFRL